MQDIIVTGDGSRTCHSLRYQQSYHSSNGALTEARHVFLNASGVAERLRQARPTRVLEVGFGLGLNTLLSCDLATTYGASLCYHSIEHELVDAITIQQMDYGSLLANATLSDALIAHVGLINTQLGESSSPGQPREGALQDKPAHLSLNVSAELQAELPFQKEQHRQPLWLEQEGQRPGRQSLPALPLPLTEPDLSQSGMASKLAKSAEVPVSHRFLLSKGVEVTLHLENAIQSSLLRRDNVTFHAIYLDAFSPDTNAECWQPQFIADLAAQLVGGGKLVTYSAKGDVRRAMLAAGLQVIKQPGPPGKREMLVSKRIQG